MGSIDWSMILGEEEIKPPKISVKKVIKRDGKIEDYDPKRIAKAI